MSQEAYPADDLTYTDAELVALLRAGNEEAMSQLVDRWSPAMFRVARSFVGSPQSAEDVVQEAWLGMLRGLATFEGRSSLRAWTFTILVNQARTRGAREARTIPQPELEYGAGEPAKTPEGVMLGKEVLLQVDRALSALPPRQRQVVTMRDVCGMTAEEVCAGLGISPTNQRVLLHRARAALRPALAEYYRG
jgi:RNA polymerase sigma-70 factor (ECF subfamily)